MEDNNAAIFGPNYKVGIRFSRVPMFRLLVLHDDWGNGTETISSELPSPIIEV